MLKDKRRTVSAWRLPIGVVIPHLAFRLEEFEYRPDGGQRLVWV